MSIGVNTPPKYPRPNIRPMPQGRRMGVVPDNPYPPPIPGDRDPHGLSNTEVCQGCHDVFGTKYASCRAGSNCAGCGGTGVVKRRSPPPPPRRIRPSYGSEDYDYDPRPVRAIRAWLARLRPKGKAIVAVDAWTPAGEYRPYQWMDGVG